MNCSRCGGLMSMDAYLEDHVSELAVLIMNRCLNCGNREDPTICLNRTLPQQPGDAQRRSYVFTHDVIAVRLKKEGTP